MNSAVENGGRRDRLTGAPERFAITREWAYLQNASIGPLAAPVVEAVEAVIRSQSTNGTEAYASWLDLVEAAREQVAKLLQVDSANLSFVRNTAEGLARIAFGLPWSVGDNIVTYAAEYPTNVLPWMALSEQGVELRFATGRAGRITVDDIAECVDGRTRLVALSSVQFGTGFRANLDAIGGFCRERRALFSVDAIQQLGVLPLDVAGSPVDFVVAGAHKWLLAPAGSGVFYVSPDVADHLRVVEVGYAGTERVSRCGRSRAHGMLRGLYLTLGSTIDLAVNRDVQATAARMLAQPLAGVTDIVPGYTNVYVEFDGSRLEHARVERWASDRAANVGPSVPGSTVDIPVDYRGPDLAVVAERTGLTEGEVIARHAAPEYLVFAVGFTPGFPYLGMVDPSLRLPRRSTPRPRVEAHSVAIANEQTGIYPSASPGGWHVLGTALLPEYDLHRQEPFLLRPGDTVRFVPAPPSAPPPETKPLSLLPERPDRPVLEVLAPGFLDLIVDRGRMMMGRYGLARGGPLDVWSAAQANHLAGNPPDAPTVELNLRGPTLLACADAILGFAGWGMSPLLNGRPLDGFCQIAVTPGDIVDFRPQPFGVRGYLALPGGIESRRYAASASVDQRAGIGRRLAAGDLLGAVAPASRPPPRAPQFSG